jgi:hypothetical protein
MKEDRGAEKPWPKPAYNVQKGTENQFVEGFSLPQRAGDTSCLIPHLEGVLENLGRLLEKGISDAGYGSEEDDAYLENQGVESFLKYNTFHAEQIHRRKLELIRQSYRSEDFAYAAAKDEFHCPAQQALTFRGTKYLKTENGCRTERRMYECAACGGSEWKAECTRAKGNRQIRVSFRLQRYRAEAWEKPLSEGGKRLRFR